MAKQGILLAVAEDQQGKDPYIVTPRKQLPVDTQLQKAAFGGLAVAELTPLVNAEFSYNLHHDIVTTRLNNGAASVDQNRMKLSTGEGANQSAQLFTNVPVKYYAGVGARVRFSGLFTTGVAGSTQIIGVGDSGDGYFFGFDGADFGILRRYGGNPEIHSIQITTKSTTAENITITLDGDADATVTVTDASATDATTTANDIVAHDFSDLGRGWKAVANGDIVNFISYNSQPRNGTYSLSGATTAVGVESQKLAGTSPTEEWTKQTAWNVDRFLQDIDPENTPSNETLDPTKGNVFQIKYQWLGFGQINFYIEHPSDGEIELVHSINYANANTLPSINSPTLPLCAIAANSTNTTDMIVYSSSMAGFAEGKIPSPVVKHSINISKTFTSETTVPALTLHNNGAFQGKINRVRMKITDVSVSVDSGKPVVIELLKGATMTGASFTDHDVDESVARQDEAATAVSGGDELTAFNVVVEKDKDVDIFVEPTEFLTIAGAQGALGTDSVCKIIVNWVEDF